jgi:hypothetical protein
MLTQAGLADDAITVQLALDDQARDQAILTSLRQYALPLGRDAVASGTMTAAQYGNQLYAQQFPDNLLEAEVAYATMLRDREQTARLERRQIAPAERAYVFALIPASALNLLYQQAGYTAGEIAAQVTVLNQLRKAYLAAQAKPPHEPAAPTGGAQPAAMTPWDLLTKPSFSPTVIAYMTGRAEESALTALWKEAGAPPAAISLALQQLHQWAA